MVINSKLTDAMLLDAIYKAAAEYANLIDNSYLVIGKNKRSETTINEKSSCCAEMLRIQEAKYMKTGLKDKMSQHVDYTYGYGNVATLGFKKMGVSSFPITLIPRSIDEFVSQKYKIIFILKKKIREIKYSKVLVELKYGLFTELYENMPEELRELCLCV